MEAVESSQEPDEYRPAKRVRLDAPLRITEDVQEEVVDNEDWDDIYGNGADAADELSGTMTEQGGTKTAAPLEPFPSANHGSTAHGPALSANEAALPILRPEMATGLPRAVKDSADEVEADVPQEALDKGDELVTDRLQGASTDEASSRILEETAEEETDAARYIKLPELHAPEADPTKLPIDDYYALETLEEDDGPSTAATKEEPVEDEEQHVGITAAVSDGNEQAASAHGEDLAVKTKPSSDPDFLAAAAKQKSDQAAEWQFDSSDAESSSDSDSTSDSDSSDDSGSDSDGGYEMLDAATAAKILMSGDGDDDDGDNRKKSGDHQPRTANEQKDVHVPKPDVVVTEDMKITHLGTVERTVESVVLIKAVTPGEYQVLEAGSVLCNEKREVLGTVAETLGKVQEPIYTVAFTNAQEIEEAGLEFGSKVFYVDAHSTFVFTQPLKGMKGTDASNLHDEEAAEDELDFSDDEVEAEFKRQRKLAKRGGRGGLSRSAFNEERIARSFGAPGHDSGPTFVQGAVDAPQQHYGGGMSYDDDVTEVQEEFYMPLKRPDNLSQMMAGGMPPRPQAASFDRGRGRGRGDRGRGRGERGRGRGRGRGGFENQRRGGDSHSQDAASSSRGGYAQQSRQHRGNADSFPDRHNDDRSSGLQQHYLPPKPTGLPQTQQHPYTSYQQQTSPPPPPPQQHISTYQQPAPQPRTYEFNGYTFQYGTVPAHPSGPQAGYYGQVQPPTAQSPGSAIVTSAHVNPAFFQNQAQAQWPQQQGWSDQYHQQYAQHTSAAAAYNTAGQQQQQQQQHPQPQQNNLADILRQLGGQQH